MKTAKEYRKMIDKWYEDYTSPNLELIEARINDSVKLGKTMILFSPRGGSLSETELRCLGALGFQVGKEDNVTYKIKW